MDVDQRWLDREISVIRNDLRQVFHDASDEAVDDAVQDAAAALLATASIAALLPVLIRRRAHRILAKQDHTERR